VSMTMNRATSVRFISSPHFRKVDRGSCGSLG
jgi:hypothetical protein